MDESQMKAFADAIWEYILEKHMINYLSDCVYFYQATVTTKASGGVIGIQRPFDSPITLPCAANATTLNVGDSCTVLVFGDYNNQLVIGNMAKL